METASPSRKRRRARHDEEELDDTPGTRRMYKNIALLSGMWGLGLGAAFVQISSSAFCLIDNGYGSVSSAPLGLIMLLSSPCAVVVPRLANGMGERKVFVLASALGVAGSLVQMAGTMVFREHGSAAQLALILAGASVQGFTYASSNNLRFAVARFSPPEFLPTATALVLFGGVVSSLFGPLLSNVTRYMIPGADYAGNFLQIALLYFLFGVLAKLTDFEEPVGKRSKGEGDEVDRALGMLLDDSDYRRMEEEEDDNDEYIEVGARPLSEILIKTDLPLLTLFQCLSYNIMALYMSQVPLPLDALGYTPNQGTLVITAHMLGMFVPGLVSGRIIGRVGIWTGTCAGFLVSILGGGVMLVNYSLALFFVGMTLVGVGWNLSFVGPSALVSTIYTPKERADVLGFNDGLMLLTIGIFALTGSQIYKAINSWRVFIYTLIGISALSAFAAVAVGFRTARRGRLKVNAAGDRTREGDAADAADSIDHSEASLEGSLEHITQAVNK